MFSFGEYCRLSYHHEFQSDFSESHSKISGSFSKSILFLISTSPFRVSYSEIIPHFYIPFNRLLRFFRIIQKNLIINGGDAIILKRELKI